MRAGPLFKIMSAALWERAEGDGRVFWAPIDRQDGFVHPSSAAQVRGPYFSSSGGTLLTTALPARSGTMGERLSSSLIPER